ncbi:type I pantothenate kinase [Phenylobacterium sp.]|uniref:type I pantothenate kinase n=1 Tax=Phenylobacterium sp. TaxID=1871053 RepID=UPI003BAB07A4
MAGMDLSQVAERLAARRPASGTYVVGVTGAVAAGKSVFAQSLAEHLAADGERVELVCTDGFLLPNARLAELELTNQKGFPPSYDHAALRAALEGVRQGPTIFPGYSHVTYDVDPALARTLDPPDVLVIEGLNLVPTHGPSLIDTLVYLDAEEAHLEAWYVDRFLGLWEAAEHDPASFYARFRGMSRPEVEGLARMVWQKVNLKNLRDHIAPARAQADLVVRKGPDHAIVAVEARG